MNKLSKKIILSILTLIGIIPSVSTFAAEETVYYDGIALHWSHGRTWKVWSYSSVSSSELRHHVTANNTPSGWSSPGVEAYASEFVGRSTTYAYWNASY